VKFQGNRRRITLEDIGKLLVNNSYYILLSYLLCGEIFTKAFLEVIRSYVFIPYKLDILLLYGAVALIVIYSYQYIKKSFPFAELMILAFFWAVFLLSLTIHGEYDAMFKSISKSLFNGTLGYICFRCVKDWKKLLKFLGGTSFVITLSLFIYLNVKGGLEHYSLYLGYLLLPGVIISINEMLRKKSVLFGLNFLLGMFLQLSIGARGPVLVVLLFLVVRIIFETNRSKYGILIAAGTILIGYLIIRNFDWIVQSLSAFYGSNNLSDRIFTKFQNEQFLNGGTRSIIQKYAIQGIGDHSVTGVGLGLDRLYIAQAMGDIENASGYYPHNPFLEIWLQFGLLFGTGIIIILFRPIVRAFIKKKIPVEAKDVALIMVFVGVVPLLISSSYLTKPEFFMSLAVCVAVSKLRPAGEKENSG